MVENIEVGAGQIFKVVRRYAAGGVEACALSPDSIFALARSVSNDRE